MYSETYRCRRLTLVLLLSMSMMACWSGGTVKETERAPMVPQFPSPMAESVREHGRLARPDSMTVQLLPADLFQGRVERVMPERGRKAEADGLLVHFHGAAYIAAKAVEALGASIQAVAINLGSGSSVYERPFQHTVAFPALIDALVRQGWIGNEDGPKKLYLSAFSAGYGAVRAILREHADDIDGIVLLDGMHASYVPEGRILFEGGSIQTADVLPFVDYAVRATAGEKRLVITHSEIFPGAYASTTETADFLLTQLGLERTPVLAWGPGGMQQVSETRAGHLIVLGFAGNTAPDHVDHLHGLPVFLKMMLNE